MASYQLMVPAVAVASSVTVPASHLDAGVVLDIAAIVKVVLAESCKTGSPTVPPYSTMYPLGW